MDSKINYVIAAWSGNRRTPSYDYELDRSSYLRKHINMLSNIKHNLSQITIVINHNPVVRPDFEIYVEQIPKQIQQAEVVIVRRPNVGISYGAFSHVMGIYKGSFDYFFVVEDDYVFAIDNFDSEMTEMFTQKENCGYLCSFMTNKHAAMPHGLISTWAINKIWGVHGEIPYARGSRDYGESAQLSFSNAFINQNISIYDYFDRYSSQFYNIYRDIVHFGDTSKPVMVKPVQLV